MTVYRPDPDSLAGHPTPTWWRDAKLGVMMHWGLSSVPAWAPAESNILELLRDRPDDALSLTPYAEWYENSLKFPEGPTAIQHARRFGDRTYASFRAEFEAGLANWDPNHGLDLIKASGARYFVPVTKHHDGYCLWPTAVPNPAHGGNWRAPRDVVGELCAGARRRGLRFGVYYSGGLDWTLDPRPIANLAEMRAALPRGDAARALLLGHYRELINRYDPDILWNDIGYPDAGDLWGLLAGYYTAREDRLINDRFQLPDAQTAALQDPQARAAMNHAIAKAMATPGFAFAPSLPPVWDHRTPEYATFSGEDQAWETVRGVGHSFGYNSAETDADHLDGPNLIQLLVRVVGDGGNLLINIGPRADGSIPDAQARPLRRLGEWLERHGAAIYGTRPAQGFNPVDVGGVALKTVAKADRRFGLLAGAPIPGEYRLRFGAPVAGMRYLDGRPIATRPEDDTLVVTVEATAEPATVYELL